MTSSPSETSNATSLPKIWEMNTPQETELIGSKIENQIPTRDMIKKKNAMMFLPPLKKKNANTGPLKLKL